MSNKFIVNLRIISPKKKNKRTVQVMIISPKDIRFTNEILAVTYGYIFMFRLNYTNRRNVMQKNLFLKVANKRKKKISI